MYTNDTPVIDIFCKYNANNRIVTLTSNNAAGNVLYIANKQIIHNCDC